MSCSQGRLAITLGEQDAAIAELRREFAVSRRTDPAIWEATGHSIEVEAVHSTSEIEGSTLTTAETAAVMHSSVAYGAVPFRDFAAAVGDAHALIIARRLD